ncbi:Las1-like-domain-containing protein [Lentinula lateritia]|uniref:Las1-like-domain-containing protein n=1 Tax=Lentinula aff. lateritia TaxID=2804960 RepID=A0ACC1U8L2_9AGAR|nr:Las1-like-domain-containing protein [Lentinula aff. lateritia]KAJ3856659.1 Las1-like-domain-containing protein [Lentinula lateritia]
MKLPRRVPWASVGELDEVCVAIYADESNLESKIFAVNKLVAWKAITSLPHAIESTLSLLSVIVQDDCSNTSSLVLRHSYSAAVIRMVNGLVDPLQFGIYARSIAAIAVQLGLPAWLVELRHAATHEDLPSLEVLREAARQSMTWLLHNYWFPTLDPSTASQPEAIPLRPLEPILKEYRSLLKLTTRDASLNKQYKQAMADVSKDIEKWIAEATVAANVVNGGLGWDQPDGTESSRNAREQWALEAFSEVLIEKGGLVPLSKKKRVFPPESFCPPENSVRIWTPLLTNVQAIHPEFLSILVNRALSRLLATSTTPLENDAPPDPSYDSTLARWIIWLVDRCDPEQGSDENIRADMVASLLTVLGPGSKNLAHAKKNLNELLSTLCIGYPSLSSACTVLQSSQQILPLDWTAKDLSVMEDRLSVLVSLTTENEDQTSNVFNEIEAVSSGGWNLLDSSCWKPCPIGVACAPIFK